MWEEHGPKAPRNKAFIPQRTTGPTAHGSIRLPFCPDSAHRSPHGPTPRHPSRPSPSNWRPNLNTIKGWPSEGGSLSRQVDAGRKRSCNLYSANQLPRPSRIHFHHFRWDRYNPRTCDRIELLLQYGSRRVKKDQGKEYFPMDTPEDSSIISLFRIRSRGPT